MCAPDPCRGCLASGVPIYQISSRTLYAGDSRPSQGGESGKRQTPKRPCHFMWLVSGCFLPGRPSDWSGIRATCAEFLCNTSPGSPELFDPSPCDSAHSFSEPRPWDVATLSPAGSPSKLRLQTWASGPKQEAGRRPGRRGLDATARFSSIWTICAWLKPRIEDPGDQQGALKTGGLHDVPSIRICLLRNAKASATAHV